MPLASDLSPFTFPFVLLLAAACGGGNGDATTKPRANAYGNGTPISKLVRDATWLDASNMESVGCEHPADRHVVVTGTTIVAIDRFDETSEGAQGNFYVQDSADEPGPFSGMTVFRPSFSPPDLRVVPGDVVDVNGVLTEFLGPSSGRFGYCRTLPEIGGTMSFRFEDEEVTPKLIPLDDLKSYETARQHIGMLVRVKDVTIAGDPELSGGRYTAPINVGAGVAAADVPRISNELYDVQAEGPPIAAETSFRAVTGVVTYFYGFKIAPRSPADFEL